MSHRPSVAGIAASLFAGLVALSALPDLVQAQTPAPQRAPPVMGAEAVAFVDDEAISTYQLKQRMAWLAVARPTPPTQAELPELQREALMALVDEKIQTQELKRQEKRLKLKPGTLFASDAAVDEAIADMAQRQNNMSVAQFTAILESRGVSIKTLRDQIRIGMSWNDWIRAFYSRRVRVSDDKIDAMLREIAAATSKPSYLISEIFIDAGRAGGVDNAVNAASQIIGLVQQNSNFELLAQQYSALPSARSGGDAGWFTIAELEPEIASALENLRPGQLAPPIRTSEGAYVILLRDRRAGDASSTVSLRWAAVNLPADATPQALQQAQTALTSVKARASGGCSSLDAAAQNVRNVTVADLGETDIRELAPAIREAVEKLQPNQISDPVRTSAGLHLIALCGRSASGAGIPTRQQVANQLIGRELAMIERRELRNLRNAATISQPR